MDSLTNLYDRLRQRPVAAGHADRVWPDDPPPPQDWLHFWNDADTDLGNLRNIEHWMSRARPQLTPKT